MLPPENRLNRVVVIVAAPMLIVPVSERVIPAAPPAPTAPAKAARLAEVIVKPPVKPVMLSIVAKVIPDRTAAVEIAVPLNVSVPVPPV